MSPDSSNPTADAGSPVADLKLVDEAEEFPSHSRDGAEDESTQRSLPIWMFVVGLIVAVVVIGWQAQLAGELEAEVAGLESQLERSNTLLEAHRSHLGEIRGGVHDLSERLDGLRALVDGGPASSGPRPSSGPVKSTLDAPPAP